VRSGPFAAEGPSRIGAVASDSVGAEEATVDALPAQEIPMTDLDVTLLRPGRVVPRRE
jgi:hypothetical protein